jgi:TonB-linked SusC/RagA family outer membrane protein
MPAIRVTFFILLLVSASARIVGAQDTAAPPARPTADLASDPLAALERRSGLKVLNVPLHVALDSLRSSASVRLLYSPSIVPNPIVSCDCAEFGVGAALTWLLRGTGFDHIVSGGQVVIVRSSRGDPLVPSRPDDAGTDPEVVLADGPPESARSREGPPARSAGATIAGTLVDRTTGEAIPGATVTVRGSPIAALTGIDGTFRITNVPPGEQTLWVQRLGYQGRQVPMTLDAGGTTTIEIEASPAVLTLQGVVATGLVDPVEGVRSPITVARVTRETMPVTAAGGAIQSLQGRVAGLSMTRRSGQPGSDVSVMLRTPTSVTQPGSPLIIVDGAIVSGETTNFEALDIESIEVIKGAAAASLYGSRAAAGVISVSTARGRNLPAGQMRFTSRTEGGRSEVMRGAPQPTHHPFLMDAQRSTYVDRQGNPVSRDQRVLPATDVAFLDQPYPGPVFDNASALHRPGFFGSQSLSLMRNSEDGNFAASLHRVREVGALTRNQGYARNSGRLNLDQRVLTSVNFSLSAFHSQDWRDEIDIGLSSILRAPPDVDLTLRDEKGAYFRVPDPTMAYENPLWRHDSRESERTRARSLTSAALRWIPSYYLSFLTNVSVDREDSRTSIYVPKGTPLSVTEDVPSEGSLTLTHEVTETWNAEGQVSFQYPLGRLQARTTLRGIFESADYTEVTGRGTNFYVYGVPKLDAAATRTSSSLARVVRSKGYLWDSSFDYDGKYILTLLGRRDGSSLFGPDNRWHDYYRIAAAWRVAEEPWFAVPHVDEFKLRYARGTAGGRPSFAAQYETWVLTDGGLAKGTLGNRHLRPEHTMEQEVALEAILLSRIALDLNYAWQRTTDQLVDVPVPAHTGYASRWQNAGTVVGSTFEVGLEAQLFRSRNVQWSSSVVFDRSRARISEWPIPCRAPIWRMWCSGVGLHEIWSAGFLTSPAELLTHHGGAAAGRKSEFDVNDDGWLVWVGAGNSFRDGLAKGLWGSSAEIGGVTYRWGMPIMETDPQGAIVRRKHGDGAHSNLGWTNSLSFGALSVHTHLHAVLGGQLANQLYRTLRLEGRHPEMDQSQKAEELKKPVAYYTALEGGRGNNSNLEPAGYVKLRTLSVSYSVPSGLLNRIGFGDIGMRAMSVGLIGRNVFNLHRCTCPDPEQGLDLNSRLPMLNTTEGYPTTRSWTAEVTLTF